MMDKVKASQVHPHLSFFSKDMFLQLLVSQPQLLQLTNKQISSIKLINWKTKITPTDFITCFYMLQNCMYN
jgi:hypothetical protein